MTKKHFELSRSLNSPDEENLADVRVDVAESDGTEKEDENELKIPVWSLILRVLAVFFFLYCFICSLDLLGSAFKLLGGKTAGQVFSQNKIVTNPVAGLMIGVLVTVLLQSSSTSSSLVVAMVASSFISVETAVPIIMGANIGTSVTNTIVALSQIRDSDMYQRAFAAATVHDMFNILTMTILLPLEWITHFLTKVTGIMVSRLSLSHNENAEVELLSRFTDPLTDMVVKLNKTYISEISKGNPVGDDEQVLQRFCDDGANLESVGDRERCPSVFSRFDLSDKAAGAILLTISLVFMFACLIVMVKILKSIFQGHISKVINKTVNSGLPGKFNCLTGYVAIVIGAVMTVLVQSSSIFTSTLTPLVGLNIISLERAFPLTLGSNIGTTVTSMLAAFASDSNFDLALQISLCHLLFNVIGIMIWYPIPKMRRVPLSCAEQLGVTTSKYPWFAFAYIAVVFLVFPAIIFALSLAGTVYVAVFCSMILLFAVLVGGLKLAQVYCRECLPEKVRDFKFLPKWMRSLAPFHNTCVALMGKLRRKEKRGSRTRRITESSRQLTEGENGDFDCDMVEMKTSVCKNKDTKPSDFEKDYEVYIVKGKEEHDILSPDEKIHRGKEATEELGTEHDSAGSSSSSSSSKSSSSSQHNLDVKVEVKEDRDDKHSDGCQHVTTV